MPIRLRNNPYRGVNAHLQSYLLTHSASWVSFHTEHIVAIRQVLSEQLPEGYYALSEQSLQIYEEDPLEQMPSPRKSTTRPDISVFNEQFYRSASASAGTEDAGINWRVEGMIMIPLLEAIAEVDEDAPVSVVIYQEDSPGDKPVLRIELLSPGNTPGYAGFSGYRQKRLQTLQAGISVVEISYLHTCHPTFDAMPDYSLGAASSHPFALSMFYPVPTLHAGNVYIVPFDVDMLIPSLILPLVGTDIVQFDLQSAYLRTFDGQPAFSRRLDYSELPLAFDTYSPADQERIRARMEAIRTESE